MYEVRKTFDHSLGISCCFRQWPATHSHCHFLHGYALKIVLVFQSESLNECNWVTDFGGLKEVKQWIVDTFDHKTLVAKNDPQIVLFREMAIAGLIDLIEVETIGCEMFARMIYDYVRNNHHDGNLLERVEVHEHGGNMAAYSEGMPLKYRESE